jgi:hypothetical protein
MSYQELYTEIIVHEKRYFMDKMEHKNKFKNLYLPKNSPCIIQVPSIFAAIDGEGDPNGNE